MASVYKRPGRKTWTAFYRDVHGRQHCKSTGAHNKKQALKVAEEYEKASRERRTLKQIHRVLDQMHELVSGERVCRVTVAEYVEQWLSTVKPQVAPASYNFYSMATSRFLAFLGERASSPITSITKNDLLGHRAALSREVSATTVNHHLACIRMFFAGAYRDGLISDNPSEHVGSIKKEQGGTKRRDFTVPEIEALLAVAAPEWRSLIHFGLYSGQRLGDLASLTWAGVDLVANELRIMTAKTGRVITLPLAAPLRTHIETLASPDSLQTPLHPKAASVPSMSTLSSQFADLLVRAGLREKREHVKTDRNGDRRELGELTYHSLRHSVVSMLKGAGVPQSVVQAFVGHSSTKISQLYTHVGADALSAAAQSLPAIKL
jgi:integrase